MVLLLMKRVCSLRLGFCDLSLARRLSLIAFLGLILVSCGRNPEKQAGRDSSGRGVALPVEAVVLKTQVLKDKIFTTGTLLANEEVELRSEISGRITGVFFQEGKPITKGAVLLKIDDSQLQAQFKRKELEEKLASDEERRQQTLYEIKAISQQEYDKALNALKLIQAEREEIESQLAKTELKAPFDGVVGLRYVSKGGFISSAMLAATMQELDPMKVEFSVPEKYGAQVKAGMELMVRVGDSQVEYQGTVYAAETKIDPDTRTVRVRGKIPNPQRALIPGSFARVEITLAELPNAIVIPSGAIIPEMTGEKVFLCTGGKARSVSVKTGIRTERNVQVTDGLTSGDTLIVTGILQLANGKGVQIKAFQSN